MRTLALATLLLAACGGDDSSTAVDAPPSSVMKVACGGVTPTVTIDAPNTVFAFSPATSTIAVDQVVAFTMGSTHTAVSDTALFRADAGTTTCFKFTAAGTFPFHCDPHLFTGSIVVQ